MSIKEAFGRMTNDGFRNFVGDDYMDSLSKQAAKKLEREGTAFLTETKVLGALSELKLMISAPYPDVKSFKPELGEGHLVSVLLRWNYRDETWGLRRLKVSSGLIVSGDPTSRVLIVQGKSNELLKENQWSQSDVLVDSLVDAYSNCITKFAVKPFRI